jgi:hypothetical protein
MTKRMGNNTVVIVHAALTTDPKDNTQYRDWTNATRTEVRWCMVQPFQLSSRLQKADNQAREWRAAYFRIWFPAGTVLDAADRLEFNGQTHDVYGEPGTWWDLNGVESHITCLTLVREG